MEDETKKLIAEQYQELPPKLQELLMKPVLTSTIRVIAEKHHLSVDKAVMLENEVVLTLLAFESLESFDERIMAELLIPGSVATSIERDLNEMVFGEVREELDALLEEQERLETTETESLVDDEPSRPVIAAEPSTLPTSPTAAPNPVAQMPRYVKDDPYRESPK